MSDIVWIAVPDGRVADDAGAMALRLRVALVPRLDGGTLAASGLAQWPPLSLATGRIVAEFATSPQAALVSLVSVVPTLLSTFDATLWPQCFPATTPIDAPGDPDARELRVRASSADGAAAQQIYAAAARGASGVGLDGSGEAGYAAAVADALQAHPLQAPEPTPAMAPQRAAPAEPPGFHARVGLLREHPAVLRALGLALELHVAANDVAGVPATGVVRVRWSDAPADVPQGVSPWTAYELATDRFSLPRPQGG